MLLLEVWHKKTVSAVSLKAVDQLFNVKQSMDKKWEYDLLNSIRLLILNKHVIAVRLVNDTIFCLKQIIDKKNSSGHFTFI